MLAEHHCLRLRRPYTPEIAKKFFRTIKSFSVFDMLERRTIPVLVLSTRDDAVFRSAHSEQTARAIPGADQVLLNGANHISDAEDGSRQTSAQPFSASLVGLCHPGCSGRNCTCDRSH